MSRTFKKFAYGCFRSPKGYRQAKIAGVRKRKVPPSSYDDVSYDKQCWLPYRISDRLAAKAWSYQEIIRYLMRKFKIRMGDAEWMAESAVRREGLSRPEGLLKVYEEKELK
jgi:hypothetical protein